MARALVLGESDLDEADNQAFRASGLAHLLAVSGTHLVLVVVGAVARARRRPPAASRGQARAGTSVAGQQVGASCSRGCTPTSPADRDRPTAPQPCSPLRSVRARLVAVPMGPGRSASRFSQPPWSIL